MCVCVCVCVCVCARAHAPVIGSICVYLCVIGCLCGSQYCRELERGWWVSACLYLLCPMYVFMGLST